MSAAAEPAAGLVYRRAFAEAIAVADRAGQVPVEVVLFGVFRSFVLSTDPAIEVDFRALAEALVFAWARYSDWWPER